MQDQNAGWTPKTARGLRKNAGWCPDGSTSHLVMWVGAKNTISPLSSRQSTPGGLRRSAALFKTAYDMSEAPRHAPNTTRPCAPRPTSRTPPCPRLTPPTRLYQHPPLCGTPSTSMTLLSRPCTTSKPLSLAQYTATSRRSLRAPTWGRKVPEDDRVLS